MEPMERILTGQPFPDCWKAFQAPRRSVQRKTAQPLRQTMTATLLPHTPDPDHRVRLVLARDPFCVAEATCDATHLESG